MKKIIVLWMFGLLFVSYSLAYQISESKQQDINQAATVLVNQASSESTVQDYINQLDQIKQNYSDVRSTTIIQALIDEIKKESPYHEVQSDSLDTTKDKFFGDRQERLDMIQDNVKHWYVATMMNIWGYEWYPWFKKWNETVNYWWENVHPVWLFEGGTAEVYNVINPEQSWNDMQDIWELYERNELNNYYVFEVKTNWEKHYMLRPTDQNYYIDVTKEYHNIDDKDDEDDWWQKSDFKDYINMDNVDSFYDELGTLNLYKEPDNFLNYEDKVYITDIERNLSDNVINTIPLNKINNSILIDYNTTNLTNQYAKVNLNETPSFNASKMEELFDDKHIVWGTRLFVRDVKWYEAHYDVSFDKAIQEVYNYYNEIKNKVKSEINRQWATSLDEQIVAVMDALYSEVWMERKIVTGEPWNPLYTYIEKRTRSWWLNALETLWYALAEVDTKIWGVVSTIRWWAPHAWTFFYEWNDNFWREADWYNDAPWTTTTHIMDFANSIPSDDLYIIKHSRKEYTEGLDADEDWWGGRF